MVADLNRRMEGLGRGAGSEACVVIDEASGLLHPRLQMSFLPMLRDLFPRAQFIVSTHSVSVPTRIWNSPGWGWPIYGSLAGRGSWGGVRFLKG